MQNYNKKGTHDTLETKATPTLNPIHQNLKEGNYNRKNKKIRIKLKKQKHQKALPTNQKANTPFHGYYYKNILQQKTG